MRALAIFSAIGLGGATIGAHQGIIPVPGQMAQAITALGGNPASMPDIHIRSLTGTLDYVRGQIEHPDPDRNAALGLGQTKVVVAPGFDAVNKMMQSAQTATVNGNHAFGARAIEPSRQATEQARDMANFTRNPGAFHGIPPR